jgi:glycogen debranching enzyme
VTDVRVRAGLQYGWCGPSLLIVDDAGAADAGRHWLHGFYVQEARFLNRIALTINGERPWLCESASLQPDRLSFAYIYPELSSPGGGGTGQSDDQEHLSSGGLPERALDVQLLYNLHATYLHITVTVANRSRRRVEATCALSLDADFADLLEAQSGQREQQAAVDRVAAETHVAFRYQHPRLPFSCEVHSLEGWVVRNGQPEAHLALDPQSTQRLVLDVLPVIPGEPLTRTDSTEREAAAAAWTGSFTRVDVPGHGIAGGVLASNIRDIASFASLMGARDEWLTLDAGMPLYPAFFGRDAVTAGWQAAMLDGGTTLEAALTRLGRMQATSDDAWTDAQPGRIPYQMRTGPLARLGINPYGAYYADYASPLMFVISLANLWSWTGDSGCLRRHWDVARRIMDWARELGDIDGDGYLEYHTRSPQGPKNQGWKDSGDAIVYDDGRPVPSPIATCELQGYWYVAQELMAMMSAALGDPASALAHRRSAGSLKARFNRDWWVEHEHCFALALDPDKQKVGAVTSNVGHCLATGIIDAEHLRPTVDRLFAPDMFSGWGIRTLSSGHAGYDPVSYHRGSVWAVEQGTIVFGLRRFGFNARAIELASGVFELAQLYPDFRIPECVGGYSRGERAVPGAYPRTNTPQLWNATTFPLIVQSLLGLVPLAQLGTLLLDPVLPEWLPSLTVRGLRIGGATVTLSFERRDNGTVDWDVVHRRGTLRIVRQPPPESVSAGASDRIWGLVESLMRSGRQDGGSPSARTLRRVGRAAGMACLAVGGAALAWSAATGRIRLR